MADREQLQYRRLTLRHFLREYKNGWISVFKYFLWLLKLVWYYVANLWPQDGTTSKRRRASRSAQDDLEIPITYGFRLLSKVCAIHLTWIYFFLFDVRLGLRTSFTFAGISYCVVLTGIFVAFFMGNWIFSEVVAQVLPEISMKRDATLISFGVFISELGYSTLGFGAMAWAVHCRHQIDRLLLHKCSKIFLPKSFQRRLVMTICVTISTLSIMAEPLFTSLTIYENFRQPRYFAHLKVAQFYLLRAATLMFVLIGSSVVSFIQNVPTMLYCYMTCSLAQHVNQVSRKQLSRFYGPESGVAQHQQQQQQQQQQLQVPHSNSESSTAQESPELAKILAASDRKIIADYSTSTLLLHWPQIDHQPPVVLPAPKPLAANRTTKILESSLASAGVSNRLFLFKNLIKTLKDLKELIRDFESIFGNYHILLIHLCLVLVGQWIVVGIHKSRGETGGKNEDGSERSQTAFITRTCVSVANFITLNLFIFVHCDQLRLELEKLRDQLYKINLDLLQELNEQPSFEQTNQVGQNKLHKISSMEIELVWSLYDSLDRISREVNFRLVGKTYYSKHCLVFIFTRFTSLVLVYLQAIDVYKTL